MSSCPAMMNPIRPAAIRLTQPQPLGTKLNAFAVAFADADATDRLSFLMTGANVMLAAG